MASSKSSKSSQSSKPEPGSTQNKDGETTIGPQDGDTSGGHPAPDAPADVKEASADDTKKKDAETPDPLEAGETGDPEGDGDYDPFLDTRLSSPLQQIVADELAGGKGKSPTLEAVNEAYKDEE